MVTKMSCAKSKARSNAFLKGGEGIPGDFFEIAAEIATRRTYVALRTSGLLTYYKLANCNVSRSREASLRTLASLIRGDPCKGQKPK